MRRRTITAVTSSVSVMKEKAMTKGDVIKKIRVIDTKESQREMADKFGVTQSAISKFEQGQRKPPLHFLEKFLKTYHINLLEYPDK